MKEDEVKKRLVELADGSLVENDVLNIVEKIKNYDPNLRVKYVDPARAQFGDAPYRVTEMCPDGLERLVMEVWELDEKVFERIIAADNSRNNVLLSVDNANLLAAKIQERRYEEIKLEDQDILTHYLKSPKGRYSFRRRKDDALVTIDDQHGRRHKVEERK
jgi:hypothetical protein